MDFFISEHGFEPNSTYYFYDFNGRLASFKSNKEISEGKIVFANTFIQTHVMKVVRVWTENNKLFVKWDPSEEVPLCVIDDFRETKSHSSTEDWREWVAEADHKARMEWARDKGKEEAVIEIVENCLSDGWSLEQVAKAIDYPIEKLLKLVEQKKL